MFALLYFSFSLIALAIASFTDLKQRIVSDKISYGLLVFGILLHGAQSALANDYSFLLASIAVTAVTFAAGFGLWKIGVWAGGDVKLFTGLAAMNPTNPNILGSLSGIALFKTIGLPIFPLSLFVFSVFAMLPFGIILSISALREKKEKRKALFGELKKIALQSAELAIATTAIGTILLQFNQNVLLVLPILLILGLLPKAFRIAAIVLAAVFALAIAQLAFASNTISLFALLFVFFAAIKLALESRELLNKEKKITGLLEGEIPAETIILKNNKVERFQGIKIGKIINYLKTNNLRGLKEQLQPNGTAICSHRRAAGLSTEEITQLKKLVEKGLMEDRIETKQSAAFVPAVLIAFILLNILGDLIWNIALK